jgi:hypothetical protein
MEGWMERRLTSWNHREHRTIHNRTTGADEDEEENGVRIP